jgi:hypothetical protein
MALHAVLDNHPANNNASVRDRELVIAYLKLIAEREYSV